MRRVTRAGACLSSLVIGVVLLHAGASKSAAKNLRAGTCVAEITPTSFPIITSGGFLASTAQRADGTLHARALALDDGKKQIVICVVDTLMMPRELLDRVKLAASRSTRVPPERMLICATHTHSAPALMGALGTDANPEYVQFVEPRIVQVIEGAVKNLAPAKIGWAVAQDPAHTFCRRWILRSDKVRRDPFGELSVRANMHPGYQNPDFVGPAGPVDPGLTVLALQSPQGRPLALLANYSMHYVGVPGGVVSPDYYGSFVEIVERLTGVEAAMMSQGTSGDQHWMDYSRPKQEMNPRMYAEALGRIVHETYKNIQYHDWVPLAMSERRLRLSRRTPDAARLSWAREIVAGMGGAPPKNQQEVYAREQMYLAAEPERELKLQAVRIGDFGIAAIPNEVFAITGLKIKAQSPLNPTINIELANGAEGYIPPPEQHKLGGYTTWPARTAALEPYAEPRIVNAVLELLEGISGKKPRPVLDPHGAYADTILSARPLAYWRGGEFSGPVARDASRHRNDGVYEDGIAFFLTGPASPAFSGDQINRAPHFAGGRLKADLAKMRDRYTVELWFNNGFPSDARPVTGCIFSRGRDRVDLAGGKLRFAGLPGIAPIGPHTWHHLVLVRDADRFVIYLDGKAAPEISGAAPQPDFSRSVYIGGSEDGSACFEGKIDEISVYDRAMTAREAIRHYMSAMATSPRTALPR